MRIVGGKWRGLSLQAPQGSNVTRPTTDRVREALGSMVESAFGLDMSQVKMLDAYAGTGALGIEFLSRGATLATFVDVDRKALACIKANLQTMKCLPSAFNVVSGDVDKLAYNGLRGRPFNLVVLDPPYKKPAGEVDKLLDVLYHKQALTPRGFVIYEHEVRTDALSLDWLIHKKTKKYGSTLVELYEWETDER